MKSGIWFAALLKEIFNLKTTLENRKSKKVTYLKKMFNLAAKLSGLTKGNLYQIPAYLMNSNN